jgi:hypothetical protein
VKAEEGLGNGNPGNEERRHDRRRGRSRGLAGRPWVVVSDSFGPPGPHNAAHNCCTPYFRNVGPLLHLATLPILYVYQYIYTNTNILSTMVSFTP